LTFHANDSVTVRPLRLSARTLHELEDNLLLFFTGYSRAASPILQAQNDRTRAQDAEMLANLHYVKEIGRQSQAALESGDLIQFGQLLLEQWEQKKRRGSAVSNPQIDSWHSLGMLNGAIGGKLVGAGGGGFLMFYAADRARLRHAMTSAGLEEVRFKFDFEGAKVVLC
jgi:D-glycero-alpha-D-manno-heptose-7-phosphate kinase